MSANETQIGGGHYKTAYEHWDWAERLGLGYLESAATKYVARYRKKNGREDLEKAIHYTEKLIELASTGPINEQRRNRVWNERQGPVRDYGWISGQTVAYAVANRLDGLQVCVSLLLATWTTTGHLLLAIDGMRALLAKVPTGQPDPEEPSVGIGREGALGERA